MQSRLLLLCTDKPTLSSSNERSLKREVFGPSTTSLVVYQTRREGFYHVWKHFGFITILGRYHLKIRSILYIGSAERVKTLYTHWKCDVRIQTTHVYLRDSTDIPRVTVMHIKIKAEWGQFCYIVIMRYIEEIKMYLRYKESNDKFLQCCLCITIKRCILQTKHSKLMCIYLL